MEMYFTGLAFGMIAGFGFGRAFEYWLMHSQAHTPREKD